MRGIGFAGVRRKRAAKGGPGRMRKDKMLRRGIFWALLLLFLWGGYLWLDGAVRPVLAQTAQVQIQEMLSVAVNDAVREQFMEEGGKWDFFQAQKGEDGSILYLSADTASINLFTASLTERIHENIQSLEEEWIKVPLGSILGSELLSQNGPSLRLKVKPLGPARIEYQTDFTQAGINQTRCQIQLTVTSQAKPLIPFAGQPVTCNLRIPVAEAVIVGDVPGAYVNLGWGAGGAGNDKGK